MRVRNLNLIAAYLGAIVLANFIAKWVGQWGLVITGFLLIPFDFIIRSVFHETWKGWKLIRNLGGLILLASTISYFLNHDIARIAVGSGLAFFLANIVASIFYQITKNNSYFVKVNGSDIIAIITDSFIFQWIAFQNVNFLVMTSQISIKIAGGLFWYWVFFQKFKIQKTFQ